MWYEVVIWLEVHIKLNSKNKLFCRCHNEQEFDDLIPNTHICPVCTGQPWALPVLNQEPLTKAVLLGVALGCHIQELSTFDRKSYFYPDLPMGYQITQQVHPTSIDGKVPFYVDSEYSEEREVRIRDAHIETDTAKSSHQGDAVLLDFNRAGTPLVEIVTYPDFRSDDEVIAFLKELQRVARYNMIGDADMDKGQMRCDVNISLRPVWVDRYGTKVEIKNMNSFGSIRRAIAYEQTRQEALLTSGQQVAQETRWRDDAMGSSYLMRSKEDAMDYRYMPEPDLPPLKLGLHRIDQVRSALVASPHDRIRKYSKQRGFNKEFINWLISDSEVNTYFEQTVVQGHDPKLVAKWIVGPVAARLNEHERSILELPFSTEQFGKFLQLQADNELINQHAKIVIWEMLEHWSDPQQIIEDQWLIPVDAQQIVQRVEEVFEAKPELLDDLVSGNMKPLGFVIGQVMQKSEGAADPQLVQQVVREKIS